MINLWLQNILVAANSRGRLADFDISVDTVTRTSSVYAATRVGFTAGFEAPELQKCVGVVCVGVYICGFCARDCLSICMLCVFACVCVAACE